MSIISRLNALISDRISSRRARISASTRMNSRLTRFPGRWCAFRPSLNHCFHRDCRLWGNLLSV